MTPRAGSGAPKRRASGPGPTPTGHATTSCPPTRAHEGPTTRLPASKLAPKMQDRASTTARGSLTVVGGDESALLQCNFVN